MKYIRQHVVRIIEILYHLDYSGVFDIGFVFFAPIFSYLAHTRGLGRDYETFIFQTPSQIKRTFPVYEFTFKIHTQKILSVHPFLLRY